MSDDGLWAGNQRLKYASPLGVSRWPRSGTLIANTSGHLQQEKVMGFFANPHYWARYLRIDHTHQKSPLASTIPQVVRATERYSGRTSVFLHTVCPKRSSAAGPTIKLSDPSVPPTGAAVSSAVIWGPFWVPTQWGRLLPRILLLLQRGALLSAVGAITPPL
ncbi:uncharacterized protein CANTADRAFT_218074 [Suhomyces tanzawaensis NRRL Y-17324]|uniref:Uncharacterized protein n=1 Tax=Suhomyces tanzawaensis NRRL Y-17324 TaxID=984487 RepID=A0A1E4SK56_9ASCO|nr:uncharacterized protein CANTADRAFT_218074 [Suhomyces tanzawaensis NRRL Y-17324]ODV79884.1 hypothetical protein CANTADRAFT_218074 [Suhomyces tanzawaensis NRRL Y-17324]